MSLEDAITKEGQLAACQGKALALRMMDTLEEKEQGNLPVIVHALAFMFAGLLAATDGAMTVHEELGLGLLGDDDRLGLFVQEVRELAQVMREHRPPDKKPN